MKGIIEELKNGEVESEDGEEGRRPDENIKYIKHSKAEPWRFLHSYFVNNSCH